MEKVKEEEEEGGLSPPLFRWRRNTVAAIIIIVIFTNTSAIFTNISITFPPSIYSGPLSRNPLYPLLEHGALCFILLSNDVLPSYDV